MLIGIDELISCPYLQVSFGAPKYEVEHVYYPHGGDGGQSWGRFSLNSILEYEVNLFELPGFRETRDKQSFADSRSEMSYAGFWMSIGRKPMSYLLNYRVAQNSVHNKGFLSLKE